MSNKNWTVLGEVTTLAYNGSVRVHASLADAVYAVGRHNIDAMSEHDNRLGYSTRAVVLNHPGWTREWGFAVSPYENCVHGNPFHFFDEMGLAIPVWKIKEAFYDLPAETRDRWGRWRHKRGDFEFRHGPVPGVHKSRWYGCGDRHPKTTAERRAAVAFDVDMDDLDEGCPRPKGRVRHNLPNAWDDIPRARGYGTRNWKEFRRAQHKA